MALHPDKLVKYRFLTWLALPFLFYLIPLLLGFSWNALGGPNPLNPPLPRIEGYTGRTSDLPITAEAWGAAVVNLPFQARLRTYLRAGELPLWNPYQGLGQSFAAQGEGSPYFPFAIVRALIPYSMANYVTFLLYYLSSIFLYLFLRGLGSSELAAAFGGMTYVLSGALSVHVARANISDQLCMLPVLFWSAAKAMRERRVTWYASFCIVSALNVLGGFIQIAMLAGVVLLAFCATHVWTMTRDRETRLSDLLTVVGAFFVGSALAAFELLPMIHAFRTAFSKNGPAMHLAHLPFANIIAFFFPTVFGYPLKGNWVPGAPSWTVDWGNLFGYGGITLLLLCVAGYTVAQWRSSLQRAAFLFFTFVALFLILRYLSVAPFDVVNVLPILGMQTPKHATGVLVFCLVVAASIAVDHVDRWDATRRRWLFIGTFTYFSLLLIRLLAPEIMTGSKAVFAIATAESASFLMITVVLSLLITAALGMAARQVRHSSDDARELLIVTGIAELSVYIPLGTSQLQFLYARLGLAILILVAGLTIISGRHRPGIVVSVIGLLGYAWIVAAPAAGLPRQFEADKPFPFMSWLKNGTRDEYRTFGIFPDFSSLGQIQDLSVVGPLAPQAFLHMVRIVGDEETIQTYETSTELMLAGRRNFPLDQYRKTKAVFNWLGVRYLVLDHLYFNSEARIDDRVFLADNPDFHVVYRDERVTIIESLKAEPKVAFASAAVVYPNEATILSQLRDYPASILGPPMLEAGSGWANGADGQRTQTSTAAVRLNRYTPNEVDIAVSAPSSGVVVLKDAYDPGWSATLNGAPTAILRVDGMVRGVVIARAGQYSVKFTYRPTGFVYGVLLASLAALLVLTGVLADRAPNAVRLRAWVLAVGGLLAAIIVATIVYVELAPLARI